MAKEKLWIFGCGDLGTRLAPLLDKKSYTIYGVRRNPLVALARMRRADGVNWRRGNATSAENIERLLTKGADIVLATFTPDEYTEDGYRRAYLDTAMALAAVLPRLEKPPRLVIWVSSTRVYGQGGDEWIDEGTPALPDGLQGNILRAAEDVIYGALPQALVVRFSGIYGPGRDRLLSQVRAGRCAPPQPPQYSNRIHVEDCVGFIAYLIEQHRAGWTPERLYIGTDSEPVPMHELQLWLARAMGYTAAHLREYSTDTERGSKKLSNQRMLATGYQLKYPDYRAGYSALLEPA
ncbi:hypothetical protein Maes01_01252 [Microbulbifer aestuariivivens]|uniref:RmlD-like substrate binding domain-containing protein n=1 Tax=Microbulbifer aestuariivivens TaxID=1908308 RepID=A0ABP9WR42_9GAMM